MRRFARPLAFLALLAFGASWFLWMLRPWQGMLDSDSAIPYLMTRTPWRLQDFYYWRAVRFGSLYVTFWKAFGRYAFGPSPTAFYLAHAELFFSGLFLWCLSLRTHYARALFLLFFLPVAFPFARDILLPGQLYAAVFFLSGLLFLLLHKETRSRAQLLTAGILCGLLFWQHELAGLLFSGIFLGDLWGRTRITSERNTSLRLFFTGALPIFAFAEIARRWAKHWKVDPHYGFEPLSGFLGNLRDFVGHGLPVQGPPQLGSVLLVLFFLGAGPVFGISPRQWRERWREPFPRRYLLFCVGFLFCAAIIFFSRHYGTNLRAPRYFLFLLPPVVYFLLQACERSALSRLQRYGLKAIGLLIVIFNFCGDPQNSALGARAREQRVETYRSGQARIASLRAAGCTGYLGPYWQSYVLYAWSNGTFPASASDHIRNPDWFDAIASDPKHCASE